MADKPAKASVKRPMTPRQKLLVRKAYALHRKLGMPPGEAWKWAYLLTMRAKDHWDTPKCGW